MKFKLHEMAVILLSLTGSSALVQSAHAQFTDTSRDLILTFREPGGLSVLEVDVGQASIYYSATSGTSIPITAYSATSQLLPLFGGVDGLSWSVGGCVPNAGDSGDPSKPKSTLWVTEPRQDPNVQASPAWSRAGSYTQGQADSKINSILDNAATWAATAAPDSVTNTPTAVGIPSGNVYNANGSLGGAGNYLGTFQGDVENTTPFDFDSAGAPSRSDLYELQPGSGPGTYLGYFELATNGFMTFHGPSPTFPAPTLSASTDTAGNFYISFPSTLNGTYSLSYTNAAGLSAPVSTWPTVSTNIIGDGTVKTFQQPISGAGTFYSVSVH